MNLKRIVAITAAGAVVAGGAGVAIGATTGKKAEQEVLADAAKRLDTTPEKLRSALSAAQDAQLDKAVKAGELTQAQADRIKADRKARGTVLGLGGPRGHQGVGGGKFRRGGPGGPRGAIHQELAKALDISEQKLHDELHAGKSVADIAKAQNKSLDSVRNALRTAARTRLDKAVADGALTRAQADDMLEHLEEHLTRLDEPGAGFGRGGHRGGPGHHGPPPTP